MLCKSLIIPLVVSETQPIFEILAGITFIAILVYLFTGLMGRSNKNGEDYREENPKTEKVRKVEDSNNPLKRKVNVEEEKQKENPDMKGRNVEWKETKKY